MAEVACTAHSCSQFHQHFTSSFCADILLPKKILSLTVSTEMLGAVSYEKSLHKMLMKWTPE